MVLLVPFDGSALSRAALERAAEFAEYTDELVLALAVVPDDPEYGVHRGWVADEAAFDVDAVARELREDAAATAPAADFRFEVPEAASSVSSLTTDVVRTIREVAAEVDASIVFVGSENAGRVSTPVCSVGAPVSEDPRYDVHIVRHAEA
jgi:nucleotide-binding universal stress UspA family protein